MDRAALANLGRLPDLAPRIGLGHPGDPHCRAPTCSPRPMRSRLSGYRRLNTVRRRAAPTRSGLAGAHVNNPVWARSPTTC